MVMDDDILIVFEGRAGDPFMALMIAQEVEEFIPVRAQEDLDAFPVNTTRCEISMYGRREGETFKDLFPFCFSGI